AARAVVQLARALFHLEGIVGNDTDGHELVPRELASEGPGDAAAVADHADMKVIADAISLGAFQNQVLQETIDAVRHPFRLGFLRLRAERLSHRAGLIYEEDHASRVGPAQFGSVHGGAPVVITGLQPVSTLTICK